MNESEIARFRGLSDAWRKTGHSCGSRGLALAEWYSALSRLAGAGPLEPVDFSLVVRNLDNYPRPISGLVEAAASAFGQRQPIVPQSPYLLQRQREALKNLEAVCHDSIVKFHPDSTWLERTAKGWRDAIDTLGDQHKNPADVTIEVTPSLLLNEVEEASTGTGYVLTLPILAFNQGELTAWNTEIKLNPRDAQILSEPKERLNIPPGIAMTTKARITSVEDSKPEVLIAYTDISGVRHSTSTDFGVILRLSRGIPPPQNPFVPGSPLEPEWFERERVFGNHQDIISDILSELRSPKGKVLTIAGCKRSGKTSIMYEVRRRLQRERPGDVLPIYVDFDEWVYAFSLHDATIDEESLMYELLFAVVEELSDEGRTDTNTEKLLESLLENEEIKNEKLIRRRFEELMERLSRTTTRALVFLLDEFDVLLRSMISTIDARRVLVQYLRHLAEIGMATLILAYDFTSKSMLHEYLGDWSHPQWGIKHLNQLQTINLARIAVSGPLSNLKEVYSDPSPYSVLALAYIWRVTGGWPGLTQILLHQVYRPQNLSKQGVIDVGSVKPIVKQLLSSNSPAFDDLKGALSEQERLTLRCLQETKAIDPSTSYISDVTWRGDAGYRVAVDPKVLAHAQLSPQDFEVALHALESNQIIEVIPGASGACRLRVGLFYYAPSVVLPNQGGVA